MKFIKLFENFENETEYGKFLGIVNVSDISYIEFTWSNQPHFSDYRNRDNEFPEDSYDTRYALSNAIKYHFKKNNINSEYFYKKLIDNDFDVSTENDKNYHIKLKDSELIRFFNLVENISNTKINEGKEVTTLADMFREINSFVSASKYFKDAEASGINVKNNRRLKKALNDWKKGIYDEDPNYFLSELESILKSKK